MHSLVMVPNTRKLAIIHTSSFLPEVRSLLLKRRLEAQRSVLISLWRKPLCRHSAEAE